ncbi:universal stress protein A [Clostridium gelidum]|uniref:Universal stress protein A n=1 Tax=Clostridium gelidum TaxID=704125 RepID=A0ABN6IUS9_9CLOT|nr:universal stress protein [Clostridium gelidum]BCZ45939.1 universal stress protein A [Clostridium gelidum]
MKKIKILVPLDTTERSTHSINWIKKYFNKNDIEIILMNVREVIVAEDLLKQENLWDMREESNLVLDEAAMELEGYTVEKFAIFGYASDQILKKAEEENCDLIIMTKSTKKGLVRMIGSVTSKVIKNAKATVIVLPK